MFIWCQFSEFGSWSLGLFVDCGEEGTLGYRCVWTEVTHFIGRWNEEEEGERKEGYRQRGGEER